MTMFFSRATAATRMLRSFASTTCSQRSSLLLLLQRHHQPPQTYSPSQLVLLRTLVSRTAVARQAATADDGGDLPYHLVVGLPALSPTMESGVLAEWYLSEGDSFAAGDAVAKIETDKASMDFEA